MPIPTPLTPDHLLALCGSPRWAKLVAAAGPLENVAAFHAAADDAFEELTEDDWLEAFAHHPRIGDVESLRERFAASGALSEQEQAGLDGAGEDVVMQLADGNERYEAKYGFVFLVRAAGRSARELLELQHARLDNTRDEELAIAAQQQREITHLRIDQTFGEH
jgi:2-oxo-4-hydroxy-4-carboxy-5-ureidoimidazoline decarboxylase